MKKMQNRDNRILLTFGSTSRIYWLPLILFLVAFYIVFSQIWLSIIVSVVSLIIGLIIFYNKVIIYENRLTIKYKYRIWKNVYSFNYEDISKLIYYKKGTGRYSSPVIEIINNEGKSEKLLVSRPSQEDYILFKDILDSKITSLKIVELN